MSRHCTATTCNAESVSCSLVVTRILKISKGSINSKGMANFSSREWRDDSYLAENEFVVGHSIRIRAVKPIKKLIFLLKRGWGFVVVGSVGMYDASSWEPNIYPLGVRFGSQANWTSLWCHFGHTLQLLHSWHPVSGSFLRVSRIFTGYLYQNFNQTWIIQQGQVVVLRTALELVWLE